MLFSFVSLEALYAEYDAGRAELERATGGKPICVEHCGKCCQGMTPVSSRLEAMYALANMSSLPSYHDLKTKVQLWLGDDRVNLRDDPSTIDADFEELKHTACPFLDDRDQSCMIYEYRPLACRSYGVLRPADPWCPRPLHYSEKDDVRMLIGEETPLATRVKQGIQAIVAYVQKWKPVFSEVGLFPSFIAKELLSKEEIRTITHIQKAKMAYRQAKTSGFSVDDFRTQLIHQVEDNHGRIDSE